MSDVIRRALSSSKLGLLYLVAYVTALVTLLVVLRVGYAIAQFIW